MINENMIKELLIAKVENEKNKNERIYSKFIDEDINGLLDLISKNEDIQLNDAIYKYMEQSNSWLCMCDENNRTNNLNKSVYTHYLKKDMEMFKAFINTMIEKMTVDHKKKLLENMEDIMSDLGNENYDIVAYETIRNIIKKVLTHK